MTPRERETAERTARVMRAARKKQALTQVHVAKHLDISQSTLSKLEAALLIPSVTQWFDFCALTKIPSDSYETGFINNMSRVALCNGAEDGYFKIPQQYAYQRGTANRRISGWIKYFEGRSKKGFSTLSERLKLDEDFFYGLDNQLNFEFGHELLREMVRKGVLKNEKDLNQAGNPGIEPAVHGEFLEKYSKNRSALQQIQFFAHHSRFYDCDFKHTVEELSENEIVVSVAAEKHVNINQLKNDDVLGDLRCRLTQASYLQVGSIGAEAPSSGVASGLRIQEAECQYHGGERCVYKIAI